MRLNLQAREPILSDTGQELDIIEIWRTIQGEGPLAGWVAAFIRLAGCNMQCPKCDTDYTTGRHKASVADVVEAVSLLDAVSVVVLTGGEPLRQNIRPLIEGLMSARHYTIQLEISGTAFQKLPYSLLNVVCSPKASRLHPEFMANNYIDYYKYVLSADDVNPTNGLPATVLGGDFAPYYPPSFLPRKRVFVQPMDEQNTAKNKANLKATVESCMKYGYTLGLQMHKICGLP